MNYRDRKRAAMLSRRADLLERRLEEIERVGGDRRHGRHWQELHALRWAIAVIEVADEAGLLNRVGRPVVDGAEVVYPHTPQGPYREER